MAIRRHIGIILQDTGSGGGTERIARRLGQAWRAEGRRVTLLMGDPRGAVEWQGDDPLPLLTPAVPIVRGRGSRASLGRWAAAVAKVEGVDALHLPGNAHLPIAPALVRGLRRADVVLTAALSNPIRRADRPVWRQWAFEVATAYRLRPADVVVAPSAALARQVEGLVPADRLHVLPIPSLSDGTRPLPPRPRTRRP